MVWQYGSGRTYLSVRKLNTKEFMIRSSDDESDEFEINIPEIEERKNGHHIAYIPQHLSKLH